MTGIHTIPASEHDAAIRQANAGAALAQGFQVLRDDGGLDKPTVPLTPPSDSNNTSSTGPTVVINNPPRNPSILKSVVTIVGLSAVAYALYKFAGGDAVEAAAEAVTTTAENVGDVEQTANQLARTLAALTKLT